MDHVKTLTFLHYQDTSSVEEAPHVEYQVINILNEYKMHTFKFRTSTDSVHSTALL